jgi:hypothetical protein
MSLSAAGGEERRGRRRSNTAWQPSCRLMRGLEQEIRAARRVVWKWKAVMLEFGVELRVSVWWRLRNCLDSRVVPTTLAVLHGGVLSVAAWVLLLALEVQLRSL